MLSSNRPSALVRVRANSFGASGPAAHRVTVESAMGAPAPSTWPSSAAAKAGPARPRLATAAAQARDRDRRGECDVGFWRFTVSFSMFVPLLGCGKQQCKLEIHRPVRPAGRRDHVVEALQRQADRQLADEEQLADPAAQRHGPAFAVLLRPVRSDLRRCGDFISTSFACLFVLKRSAAARLCSCRARAEPIFVL